jgi:hypothetical protein
MLAVAPKAISSIMGLYAPAFVSEGDLMQLWAGQAAALARAEPAGSIAQQLWEDASRLLP